tara:strand:- start:1130 stop:1402 length:273 start_codon:yes stop_codon:yes gene_type:complete
MFRKIANTFFLFSFIIFIIITTKHYFSEENIVFTNKSRSSYSSLSFKIDDSIPILKSDTENIVFHINEVENFNKKRKKRIWEKLISNTDE